MTGDVVSLGTAGSAALPHACKTEVIGTLATDMVVTKMGVEGLWICKGQGTVGPKTWMGELGARFVVGQVGEFIVGVVGDGRGRRWREMLGHGALKQKCGRD
jgi:hypothetical protein